MGRSDKLEGERSVGKRCSEVLCESNKCNGVNVKGAKLITCLVIKSKSFCYVVLAIA